MFTTLKKSLARNWEILILATLLILTIWPLFLPGYFSHHDDLQIMRIYEMRKCLNDFQIPCRWVPDMGFGNGFPLYNYYNPFPYYIGVFLSFIFGYITSAKLLFLIPLIFGPIGMYLFIKDLWGKVPGVTSAILFMFAPYRALDVYVRGALAESFAIALIPFTFYFLLKLIRESNYRNFLLVSLTLGAFFLSHTIMTILFLPWITAWCVFWIILDKKNPLVVILAFLGGIGLSAFFLIPAYFEKDLVNTDSLRIGDLNFRAHFATVKQIFLERNWGYGASVPGPNDSISLQIGWPLWFFAPLSLVGLFFYIVQRKKDQIKNLFIVILALSMFCFSVFMVHNKSAFLWELSDTLQFTQFPWRFLALSVFSASLLGGFFVSIFKNRLGLVIFVLICLSTVYLNWNYFRPQKIYNLTDDQKLSGKLWEEQQKAAILDYLPKTAYEPREKAPNLPIIKKGKAKISNFINNSNNFAFYISVVEDSYVEMPVFDFPEWTVYKNDKKINHLHNNLLGRIEINLLKGEYEIKGQFENTQIREVANLITLFSIVLLFILGTYGKSRFFSK